MLSPVDMVTKMDSMRAKEKWYYSQDGLSVVTETEPLRDSSQRSTKAKMGKHRYYFTFVGRVG